VIAMAPSTDYMVKARQNDIHDLARPIIVGDVGLVVIELQHLVNCLEAYSRAGGSQTIIDLYKLRYTIIVSWIYIVGLLSSEVVERYFDPSGYLGASRAARAKKDLAN